MKSFKIILVIGFIIAIIGTNLSYFSYGHVSDETSTTIPAGFDFYVFTKTEEQIQGYFYGDYTVSLGTVDFYVMNENQYQTYTYYGVASGYIYCSTNTTGGHFSTDLNIADTYYLVADHGAGSDALEQMVTVQYYISGVNYAYLIPGIMLLLIGIILVIIGLIRKKKTQSLDTSLKPYTDVQLFDNEQKPPPQE